MLRSPPTQPRGGLAQMHGCQGPDPRAARPLQPAPTCPWLVPVLNDALGGGPSHLRLAGFIHALRRHKHSQGPVVSPGRHPPKIAPKALLILAEQTAFIRESPSPQDIPRWAEDTQQAGANPAPAAEPLGSCCEANATSIGLTSEPQNARDKGQDGEGSKEVCTTAPPLSRPGPGDWARRVWLWLIPAGQAGLAACVGAAAMQTHT